MGGEPALEKILLIKIVYAAASIQGIFLAFLLWRTKINQPANSILGILLLIVSFHLVLVGFDERAFFMRFPHLSRISWIIGTLYGPLIFLFVQQITQISIKPYWKVLLFLPFLFVLANLVTYFLQSAEEKRAYLDAFETAMQDDFGWINQFVSVVHVVFVMGNYLFYLRWERQRSEEFSFIEAIRIQWLRHFLIFMIVITLFGVVIFFARIWNVAFLSEFYRFHFIGVVLLFYWLSYKALTQPVLFGIGNQATMSLTTPAVPEDKKPQKPRPQTNRLEEVFEKVKLILETERLYLKNDLTLTELAEKTGFVRNQVSQAINTKFKGNFFDFVNDFRVAEFKRQALGLEKRHLSQLGIALESGFSSKASFYAIFKKKTGMTPAEYLEKQSKIVHMGPEG